MNTSTTGRVLVTTHPFGEIDRDPITLLETAGISFTPNPFRRRFREDELAAMIGPYEALIAGTSRRVVELAAWQRSRYHTATSRRNSRR